MSETREALAPCPFCGSNEIVLHHIGNMHTKSRGTEIKCTTAGCSTTKRSMAIKQGFEQTDAWAIAAWNRRALSAWDERAEERGWMPIETAPKDGTYVAVARDMGETWGWVRGIASYESAKGIAGWVARCGFSEIPGVLGLGSPTHWQPLPAPPAALRAGGTDGPK